MNGASTETICCRIPVQLAARLKGTAFLLRMTTSKLVKQAIEQALPEFEQQAQQVDWTTDPVLIKVQKEARK